MVGSFCGVAGMVLGKRAAESETIRDLTEENTRLKARCDELTATLTAHPRKLSRCEKQSVQKIARKVKAAAKVMK